MTFVVVVSGTVSIISVLVLYTEASDAKFNFNYAEREREREREWIYQLNIPSSFSGFRLNVLFASKNFWINSLSSWLYTAGLVESPIYHTIRGAQ